MRVRPSLSFLVSCLCLSVSYTIFHSASPRTLHIICTLFCSLPYPRFNHGFKLFVPRSFRSWLIPRYSFLLSIVVSSDSLLRIDFSPLLAFPLPSVLSFLPSRCSSAAPPSLFPLPSSASRSSLLSFHASRLLMMAVVAHKFVQRRRKEKSGMRRLQFCTVLLIVYTGLVRDECP
ncbi:hypothetical protein C8R45DRAFT_326624 [Mycena sanguinolenta]|nr:hypothetical protein C8R45DRAFT_326624 [Mycena sanguinolenta]